MSKTRIHSLSLHKDKFNDATLGPSAALGGPFYIKKILSGKELVQGHGFFFYFRNVLFDRTALRDRCRGFYGGYRGLGGLSSLTA